MADVLNKAISSVPKEELGQSQSLTDLHQGLQLTESQLLKVCLHQVKNKQQSLTFKLSQVFNKHGLVQENPLGEKFDPNKHDALFQVNTTTTFYHKLMLMGVMQLLFLVAISAT